VATILCVLYDDPTDEQPTSYAREGVPTIERYPGGQTTPTPDAIDFTPGELLGDVTGALSQASLPATSKAPRAAATAASMSPSVPSGTEPTCSSVLGDTTSIRADPVDGTQSPPMNSLSVSSETSCVAM
jgi:hypothetical protein